MNHGKKNNQSKLDRANEFIARLLGKRPEKADPQIMPPNKNSVKKNDLIFLSIFIGIGILLWSLTGICYVPDGSYGVITQNGNFKKILKENSLILTYPYPINDFNTFSLEASKIDFGMPESSQAFVFSTQDGRLGQTRLSFDIEIQNPQQFYTNFYQLNKDSITRLRLLSTITLRRYFNNHTYDELQEQNNIVSSTELSSNLNSDFAQYGIVISKLNLTKIESVTTKSDVDNHLLVNKPVQIVESSAILNEAYLYRQLVATNIKETINDYYALLKQYNSNPQIIAELLYYRALANLNQNTTESSSFALLKLSESDYLNYNNQTHNGTNSNDRLDIRRVNRNINRERTFND